MEPYANAYLLEQKQWDMRGWYMGQYNMSALVATVGNILKGKRGKTQEYVKKPFMQELGEDYGLTQEEIDDREIKKMLAYEEMWNKQLMEKGLPEVKIARG